MHGVSYIKQYVLIWAILKKSFIIQYTEALESNGLVTFAAWHNLSLAEDTAL